MDFAGAFHRDEGERGRDEDEVARPGAGKKRPRLEAHASSRIVEIIDDERVLAAIRDDDTLSVRREADGGGEIRSCRVLDRIYKIDRIFKCRERIKSAETFVGRPRKRRNEVAKFRDEESEPPIGMEDEMARPGTGGSGLEDATRRIFHDFVQPQVADGIAGTIGERQRLMAVRLVLTREIRTCI